jgi:hypothetical protein
MPRTATYYLGFQDKEVFAHGTLLHLALTVIWFICTDKLIMSDGQD